MGKNQHVVPNDGKWSVKDEGNSKATGTFDTQKEAIERARELPRMRSPKWSFVDWMARFVTRIATGTTLCLQRTNETKLRV